jgi:hypothetical protein
MQKKKSNIMFLAHQAQDRRDILAEQYAQNRRTKREAKQKYGKGDEMKGINRRGLPPEKKKNLRNENSNDNCFVPNQ